MKRGLIVVFILMFVIFLMSSVFALDACCEQDVNGDWCIYTDENNCASGSLAAYTSCEQTSYCQVGCCYSSDTGYCYKSASKAACEAEGYSWSDSDSCEIDQCEKGCCVIGDQAFFVTEVKCKSVGTEYTDATVDFDDTIQTEAACLDSVKNLDWGCCVSEEEAKFVMREECETASEDVGSNFSILGFHEGMLCSNDLLSTECAKQQSTGCYQGKVYWYDSCGNRENIYSSDERVSYNEGYVLVEEDSCTATGAEDPNCGNCDYALGMLCGSDKNNKALKGDYICTDLNCYDTFENVASALSGGDKKNGESWCIYDSRVGMGLDTVGSRHYRHVCMNGEEVTEPCTDYREQICISGVLGEEALDDLEALHLGNGDYVEAACRDNRATDCSSCNDATLGESDRRDCCMNEDIRDCYWMPAEGIADIGEGVCVAQVPIGLKFWSDNGEDASTSSECSAASTTCTATYRIGGVARLFGGSDNANKWTLVSESPDGCTSKKWVTEQNTYCRSLGDCGAWYNYVGKAGLDGLSSNIFDEEFFFEVEDMTANDLEDWDYLQSVDDTDEGNVFGIHSDNFWKNPITWVAIGSTVAGGFTNMDECGSGAKVDGVGKGVKDVAGDTKKASSTGTSLLEGIPNFGDAYARTSAPEVIMYSSENGEKSNDPLAGVEKGANFVDKISGYGEKVASWCFLGSALPIPGKWIDVTKTPTTKVLNTVSFVAWAYVIVEYAYANETEMVYYVNCNMWQPPKGGDDCELCNSEDTPCSEYRCKSLGASCSLVNEGTSNETCVSLYVNDVNSPILEPMDSVMSEQRFTIVETEEEGDKGYIINEKIPAFTPVTLGIISDEPAQCKYTTDVGTQYEEMNNYFGSEMYVYNHSLMFSLSAEAMDEDVIALTQGVYTIYVRCSDANGNANERDYFIRFTVDTTPDLTPPSIEYTSIESGSYMPYGANETSFSIFTNEPAICKWDDDDVDYSVMNGEMECANSGFEQSSVYFGTYECSTILTGVSEDSLNNYYFKCQDQSGNTNEDAYKFTLKKTDNQLLIDTIEPSGTVYNDTVTLEVETSGGAENGKAYCGFSVEDVDYSSMIAFMNTESDSHSQDLELIPGEYTYYVTCQDIAGNQASSSTTFKVDVDDDAPGIMFLYVDTIYSYLELELDEDATCEYAVEDFIFGEGTEMSGAGTNMQESYVDSPEYYIICEDLFGNQGEYVVDLSAWV